MQPPREKGGSQRLDSKQLKGCGGCPGSQTKRLNHLKRKKGDQGKAWRPFPAAAHSHAAGQPYSGLVLGVHRQVAAAAQAAPLRLSRRTRAGLPVPGVEGDKGSVKPSRGGHRGCRHPLEEMHFRLNVSIGCRRLHTPQLPWEASTLTSNVCNPQVHKEPGGTTMALRKPGQGAAVRHGGGAGWPAWWVQTLES